MVGSSFTSPSDSNYAPIEGKCLSVANALKKTRYYTQGCEKLVVGTDHKPLLGVLNERSFESIINPRMQRRKEKNNFLLLTNNLLVSLLRCWLNQE